MSPLRGMNRPETRHLRTPDGVYIAYQTVGHGPVDVAVGFHADESNVDLMWDEPDWRPFMVGTAELARLIVHDRRGLGVSSRNVAPPNLETRVADLLAVLDAVGSQQPILVGGSRSAAVHVLFAATHPDRVAGIIWNNPVARAAWAPDYPWGETREAFDDQLSRLDWATRDHVRRLARTRTAERFALDPSGITLTPADEEGLEAYGVVIRNTATPDVSRAIWEIEYETDVRAILPSVRCPVVLLTGTDDEVAEAEYIAGLLPNATLEVIPGRSGLAVDAFLGALRRLAGIALPPPELETVLATVLFTDIVASTERQAALGDHGWKQLILAHHEIVRAALARWHGTENDTAGDGFYASFDGPARAIRCALEIAQTVRTLGIEIRAGLHTGECEVVDGKCAGLTVSIGARVAARAAASEVMVSQTVKDLVSGSGFAFSDAGEHELKGVPDRWRLYRVTG